MAEVGHYYPPPVIISGRLFFFTTHHTVRLWSCPSHKVVRFNSHKDQMLYTGPSTTPITFLTLKGQRSRSCRKQMWKCRSQFWQ